MSKKLIALLLIFVLLFGLGISVFALPNEPVDVIQLFVENAQRISRAPGISVAVVAGDEAYFFSSGLASRETGMLANAETLWELASVSKAFTALGLLYLEEQGLLSLDDSIADHLPWLTFQYQGRPMDMQVIKLYHFMHHTVGITNAQHPNLVLERPGLDTLQSTVEALIDAELAFFPGEQMQYGTKNYNILGLVIATASGQSYESFMEERIFQPLGLTQTFANRDYAEATGRLAQGHQNTFIFAIQQHDSPESRGSVPTGYIITSAYDMARWMRIQLGLITDIPEVFMPLILQSHVGDQSVEAATFLGHKSYYAAGWMVNENGARVEHGGNNPSFVTYVLLLPEEQIGITVLSNSTSPNTIGIANSIANILGGDLAQRYSFVGTNIKTIDVTFTIATFMGGLLAILFFLLGLRRKRQNSKQPISTKRAILVVFWTIMALIIGAFGYLLPLLTTGGNWSNLLRLAGYSPFTGIAALIIFCASVISFVIYPRHKKSRIRADDL